MNFRHFEFSIPILFVIQERTRQKYEGLKQLKKISSFPVTGKSGNVIKAKSRGKSGKSHAIFLMESDVSSTVGEERNKNGIRKKKKQMATYMCGTT